MYISLQVVAYQNLKKQAAEQDVAWYAAQNVALEQQGGQLGPAGGQLGPAGGQLAGQYQNPPGLGPMTSTPAAGYNIGGMSCLKDQQTYIPFKYKKKERKK